MRLLFPILALTLLASPLLPAAHAREVTNEFFYESLDPYGDWIQTADYGYVWHPKDVAEEWRPYTDGNWVYTDAGWTWVSEEPYGEVTYHYGRWTRLADTGWVWVPDTEWAPAWVSWRRSDTYVGWAPLPPEASFQHDVGISQWADSYYDIGPTQYSFVKVRDLGAPRLSIALLPARENVTIIRETRNITNITYRNNVVVNEGPQYDVVVRESAQPIRRLRLERREDIEFDGHHPRGDSLRAQVAGGSLRVFAPTVAFSAGVAPTRIARHVEHVEVDRGWRNVAQAQELRTTIQRDTPRPPAQLPAQPKFTRAAASAAVGAREPSATTNPRNNAPGREAASQVGTPADGTAPDRTPGANKRMRPDGTPLNPADATTTDRTPAGKKRVGPNGALVNGADSTAAERPPATNNKHVGPDGVPAAPGDATATDHAPAGANKPMRRDGKNPGAGPGDIADPNAAPGTSATPPAKKGKTPGRPGAPGDHPNTANRPNGPAEGRPPGPGDVTTPDGAHGARGNANLPDGENGPGGAPKAHEGRPGGPGVRPEAAPGKNPRPEAEPPTARPEPPAGEAPNRKAPPRPEMQARPEGARPEGGRADGAAPHGNPPGVRPEAPAAAARPHANPPHGETEHPGGAGPANPQGAHPQVEAGPPHAAQPVNPAAAAPGKKGEKDKDKDKKEQ